MKRRKRKEVAPTFNGLLTDIEPLDEHLSPYPLFLNSVPITELSDDELDEFTDNLAIQARASVSLNEPHHQVDAWVRHWARAESERQRRGMAKEMLFEVLC